MSQKLNWILLCGCVTLISMFGPLAVRSLAVFRLPLNGIETVLIGDQAGMLAAAEAPVDAALRQ
jgi:hypothetical protein